MLNMKTLYDGKIVDWNEEVELVSATFPVGPVPLEVTAGINGHLIIKSPITLDSLSLTVAPYTEADIGVYATGGVTLAVVKSGIEADITLADLKVSGDLTAKLTIEESKIDFDINARAGGDVGLIRAGLSFYAGTRTHIEWCSAWGIPYPCGLGWDTWDIPIYHTPWLYHDSVTLFNQNLVHEEIPLD